MSYLPSIPDGAVLMDVFRAYPDTTRPLLDYHELVLRGPSPFTVAERELIAAYVSGVNSCDYCHGVHTVTAEACGVAVGAVPAAVADLDSAPVSEKLKPVLRYVGKLTRSPSSVSKLDAEAVFAAGWDERALYHAVLVCALFNFMNRVVEGLGIKADDDYYAMSGKRLNDIGYAGLSELMSG
ncbi:MAG TPA: carboxymuconolactone decarboxylase family protein [Actinophytocola sp.]|uniref:carboxymuconolactone decarboxylase family protein n=1 Tax=Actinophytocola sp. TaxID=1872138 RepID=UPI002DDD261F|nr:carboxymuconolactone decarboxylase family protein [Actinophytocola sp.]HEV2781212.1 carboxymuconolactone decarboxylase family protein [Actinophytocola sp.]